MNNWKDISISVDTTIMQVLKIIDNGALRIAIVTDSEGTLLGTVTDGDIRRGILNGISLESPVFKVMNSNPITASIHDGQNQILALMKLKDLQQIPVLDDLGRVIKIELLNELIQQNKRKNWVILMAGGLGTRLAPLTDDCPKPLLKVGSKPILEIIIENFIEQGFYRFYISVNYRAEMIINYFGDGSRLGIEIRYIHENKRLGTAGALSLIEEEILEPVIVMNADLLTKVNFNYLLDFHHENISKATMCVRDYEFQVPYGVVKVDNHKLLNIEEKPTQRFFVSGGIYVLDPGVIGLVPKEMYYDMPTLFEQVIKHRLETTVFPIRELWIDIGRMDDFQRANVEYIKEGF
jgi:dTDP-glucose pyrophosphorylase